MRYDVKVPELILRAHFPVIEFLKLILETLFRSEHSGAKVGPNGFKRVTKFERTIFKTCFANM